MTIKAIYHFKTCPFIRTDLALHDNYITERSKVLSEFFSSVLPAILGLILLGDFL